MWNVFWAVFLFAFHLSVFNWRMIALQYWFDFRHWIEALYIVWTRFLHQICFENILPSLWLVFYFPKWFLSNSKACTFDEVQFILFLYELRPQCHTWEIPANLSRLPAVFSSRHLTILGQWFSAGKFWSPEHIWGYLKTVWGGHSWWSVPVASNRG